MSFPGLCVSASSKLAVSLLIVLAAFSAAHGQPQQPRASGGRTSINGTVTDKTGLVLAGAKVSLAGPVKRDMQSTENGAYSFTGLTPGSYTLTVTFQDFPPYVLSDINLKAGMELPIDVALEGALETTPASAQPPQTQPAEPAQPAQPGLALPPPVAPVMPVMGPQAQTGNQTGNNGAQGSTIRGTVTDPQGAVLPGAKLTLTGPPSFKQETVSADNGSYSFTGLPAGTYTLTVDAANFAQKVVSDLNVALGVELPLEIALDVRSAVEEVNVQSSNEGKVETETATVSGTIAQKEVQTLQLNGRNFSQLIALAPGVSNQTGQDEGKVGVVGSVKYSVNGGRVEYNSFEIDGSDVLNTGLNRSASTLVVYPSIDSIQEVKVLTFELRCAIRAHRLRHRAGDDSLRHESVPRRCLRFCAQRSV